MGQEGRCATPGDTVTGKGEHAEWGCCRPETAVPERPSADIWGPGFREGPTTPRTDRSGPLCLNVCTNRMIGADHLPSPGSLGFCSVPGRGCSYDRPPVKPWALSPCGASLVDSTSHGSSQPVAGGVQHVLCDATGKGLWELVPGSPDFTPHCSLC